MLDLMRRNANSWVMILLFAIIIFVFAINFGPWAGQLSPNVPYAAIVNDQAVSMPEFRTAYMNQFSRMKQFRPDYDQAQADRDGLRQMVVDNLVSRELLYQTGLHYGLAVGGKYLADEIKERVFGPEQEFSKEEYIRRVNAFSHMTVAQFEDQVKKEIIAQQIADILGSPVAVSDTEIKTAYVDRNTKAAIDFIKVSPKFFKAKEPSVEQVKAYREANASKLSDYYNEHISDYVTEEKVRASHILVKVPQNATEEEKKKLQEKAQKIHDRLKNGEDFATVAKIESEDPGTKNQGGDLDFFSYGMMVEDFSKAAFALKPGQLSEVVKTPFGFHVIKVTELKPKVERKLEDASNEIAELLIKNDEQSKQAKEFAEHALAKLKGNAPLDSINMPGLVHAKNKGKEAATPYAPLADETDSFNKTSSYVYKVGRADPVIEETFKLNMEHRTPAHVIEANGDYFAIRLKSLEEANMAEFDKQKDSLKAQLLYPRKRAFMQQYLTQLKNKAKIIYNDSLLHGGEAQL